VISEATLLAHRFGYGTGRGNGPQTAADTLARLAQPDDIAATYPVTPLTEGLALAQGLRAARKAERDGEAGAEETYKAIQRKIRGVFAQGGMQAVARILETDDPFRERLNWFWLDHFSAAPKTLASHAAAPDYGDAAIRAHVTGRFGEMLKAVVTHPLMLTYLDQVASVGANSVAGKRQGRSVNENLARELLELHTLGVGADYTQRDVRALAELLTGLTANAEKGFFFRRRIADPGEKDILGKTYGGSEPSLAHIERVLDDLAVHPATARHVSRKIAVHFISDDPDAGLVARMAEVWIQSGGDLMQVYTAMLDHPAALAPLGGKARQPFDFICAGLLALGVRAEDIMAATPKEMRQFAANPLRAMGQPYMRPNGPDGWPEAAEHWINPQGLATRIAWSLRAARRFEPRVPDPRAFLDQTLGDLASERLRFAVSAAETKSDAIALVLASAEFNLR
jgi:uncharacterized protein (DUF1800 family)